MAFPRIGGQGVPLDLGTLGYNEISLAAGLTQWIPSGTYQITPGLYSTLQFRDPITNLWRSLPAFGNNSKVVGSDGWNWRLANLTGCAVGAFITNVGSGYTSAPTVTASAGGSTWTAIVGGAISQTVTTTTAGTGYTFPPLVVISAPPAGGVQATATCALTSDGVGTITVVNQGAGYTKAPTITFFNDPRDTTGSGAVGTATLITTGTITAVICTGHGTPLTALPTLTFTGGGGASAAATVVMNWTLAGALFTVGTAGAVYGNAQPFLVLTDGGKTAGAAGAVINPAISTDMVQPRAGSVTGTSTAGGAVTATGAVKNDGGLFSAIPTGFVLPSGTGALPTTTAIVTMVVGGVTDSSLIQAI